MGIIFLKNLPKNRNHMVQFVILLNTSNVQWAQKMFTIKLCGGKFKHFKQDILIYTGSTKRFD